MKANAAHAVGQQHGKGYAHDQQHVDERRTLGGQDVALNEFGDVARLRDAGADDGGKDGGGKHSDAVGAEVLQKPRHRSQDGAVEVFPLKQRGPGRFSPLVLVVLVASLRAMQNHFFRI